MTTLSLDELSARRAKLKAEFDRLADEAARNESDLAEARQLDEAHKALDEAERAMGATRTVAERKAAARDYTAAVDLQRKQAARRRALANKISDLNNKIGASKQTLRELVNEYQQVTSEEKATASKLNRLADEAGPEAGLNPVKDMDMTDPPLSYGVKVMLGLA